MQGAARAAWRAEQGVARTPHLATTPRGSRLGGPRAPPEHPQLWPAVCRGRGPSYSGRRGRGSLSRPSVPGLHPPTASPGAKGSQLPGAALPVGGGGGWGGRRSPGWHGPPLLSRHAEALGAPGWAGRAAILEKRHGFRSAARDADRLKPAPIPLIELGDIGFMELDFLMTKNYLCGQTKTNGAQSPLWRPFGPQSPGGRLIAPGDGVIGGRGTESPFMLFLG